jgi:hypothetical protein
VSCAVNEVKDFRADCSSVIAVGDECARSPKKEHQDCEHSPASKQEDGPDMPSANNADSHHFTASKPAQFTIEYLMKMPSSAVPSRREESALEL